MKTITLILCLIAFNLFGQTYDFNTSAMDGWSLTTGQTNAGWHGPSALCTNNSGTYNDDDVYEFISPNFSYPTAIDVTISFNVSFMLRPQIIF